MSTNIVTSKRIVQKAAKPYSPALARDILQILDTALILSSGLTMYLLYVYPQVPYTLSQYLVTLLIATVMAGLLFHWMGVYTGDVIFTRGLLFQRMLLALAGSFALLLAIAFALKITNAYSRIWLVGWFCSSAAVLSVSRLYIGHYVAQLVHRGRFANRTVIVGSGSQAGRLAEHIKTCDAGRMRILGFVADDPEHPGQEVQKFGRFLGGIDDLVRMVRNDEVDQVYIALPWNEVDRIRKVTHRLALTPIPVRLSPDLAGFEFSDRSYMDVAGLPMLPLFDRPISGWSQFIKAAEDRVFALIFLLVFSGVMASAAIAVKLTSSGPILFKQKRYGFNDKLIEVWKFRTMYHHAADYQADRLTTKDDERVTPVGRFLRRTSIDELPQLFNVLRGDMSIVGPRPHALAAKAGGQFYDDVVDHYAARHKVKPGITGWAQVNGWRGETTTAEDIRKRVEYDLYYLDNWSIWFDLEIIARTIVVVFRDENAY